MHFAQEIPQRILSIRKLSGRPPLIAPIAGQIGWTCSTWIRKLHLLRVNSGTSPCWSNTISKSMEQTNWYLLSEEKMRPWKILVSFSYYSLLSFFFFFLLQLLLFVLLLSYLSLSVGLLPRKRVILHCIVSQTLVKMSLRILSILVGWSQRLFIKERHVISWFI